MKYNVYYRVSTRQQGDSGLGLEAQRAYIRHFLTDEQIEGEYTEVQSGKSIANRPILADALADAKRNGYGLAIAKLDRLSRTAKDALQIVEDMGGNVFSADLPMSPGDKLDTFIAGIFFLLAQRERELISIRTKQALAAKKARGERYSGNKLTEKTRAAGRTAQVNAARAGYKSLLVRIRRSSTEGKSYSQIARELNEEKIPTRGGGRFYPATISRIMVRAERGFCLDKRS